MAVENLFMSADISNRDYKLVFICCKESISVSYLATALDKYKTQVPVSQHPIRIKNYLENNMQRGNSGAEKDPTSMRMIVSKKAGMGKSLQIQRITERLQCKREIVQLHEKNVNNAELIERWTITAKKRHPNTVFHVDITPAVGATRNDLIFSLVVLGGIQDKFGKVWTCDKNTELYMFEMILENNASNEFTSLMPKTACLSPTDSLKYLEDHRIESIPEILKDRDSSNFMQLLDQQQFLSPIFQRPRNYLHKFFGNENLDQYQYSPNDQAGSHTKCLELLLSPRACPIQDPSYAELTHFLSYLNVQLESCEKSIFCNQMQDGWQNLQFKRFVIKFKIA